MYTEQESKNRHSKTTYSDEIDLREVFHSIGKGFRKIGRAFLYTIYVIKKRFLLISAFGLVGVAIGTACHYVTKPYYSSTMTLVLADIRNEFVENQLEKLSDMVKEDNFEGLADNLDISVNAAKEIKSMSFLNLDQARIAEDSILKGSPFKIKLSLYNNALFDSMEPAIVSYLENNRYFSKQKRINQKRMSSLISKLDTEIKSIDSLKTTISSPRGPVSGFVYGEPIDPTNLYREGITMYQQQVSLEAELEQLDNIQVVIGFTPRLRPTGPNLIFYLVFSGFVALMIGLIVAISREQKKRQQHISF